MRRFSQSRQLSRTSSFESSLQIHCAQNVRRSDFQDQTKDTQGRWPPSKQLNHQYSIYVAWRSVRNINVRSALLTERGLLLLRYTLSQSERGVNGDDVDKRLDISTRRLRQDEKSSLIFPPRESTYKACKQSGDFATLPGRPQIARERALHL